MARPDVSDAADRLYDSPALRPYRHGDGDDNGWILLHLCEAAVRTVQKASDALRHDDQGSGWRRMLDPDRSPVWALDWLRQHVGLDRFPPDFTEQQKRDMIRDSPRFRRGTAQMIRHAAGLHLTGTKTVYFNERHGGTRRYRTATLESESPDPQRVLDELAIQKPATFLWTHEFIEAAGNYDALESTHADYTEVAADFDTYADVLADPTQT
jgi:hypothetical protein